MKIFFYFLRDFDELAYAEKFSREMGVEFGYTKDYPTLDNVDLARGADAISVTPCDMSAPMVDAFRAIGVKYITCRSIGFDHVDRERAQEYGMRVSNVSYPPSGVANFAVMLMMMAQRNIPQILDRAKVQDFTLRGKIGRDLSFSTVGVIGTGKIGAEVVKRLTSFGCRILAYDVYENPSIAGLCEYVSLETLLQEADVITLHCNVTAETEHIIDADALVRAKDGVVIVNTARGKLIDTNALIQALRTGKVGAAALDVLENENGLYYYDRVGDLIDNDELAILRAMPNVLLTTHTAFYTHQAVEHMVRGCFEGALAFSKGEPTEHDVTNR